MKFHTAMVFILTLGISSFALAEGEIVIKFNHSVSPDTPKGQAAERFKQLAELNTNGRVRVEIYPNSQLYNDSEEIEALQSGAVQMLAPSLSRFGALGLHSFELFDLPFIFPSHEVLHRVTDGDIGKRMFRKLSARGMVGLAYWDEGFKQMSSNTAMHKVGSLKGMKINTQSSNVLETQLKVLGASSKEIPINELYPALQQGIADGAENPISIFHNNKLYEVQKHLTISDHGYLGYAVVANKAFWDDLPTDIRDALKLSMKEATALERDLALNENDVALAKVIAANTTEVYELSSRERTAWQQSLLPVYQEFQNVIGRYLIKSVAYTAQQIRKEQNAANKK